MHDIRLPSLFKWATRNNHVDVIKFLLKDEYQDIIIPVQIRQTFRWAAENGHTEMVI